LFDSLVAREGLAKQPSEVIYSALLISVDTSVDKSGVISAVFYKDRKVVVGVFNIPEHLFWCKRLFLPSVLMI